MTLLVFKKHSTRTVIIFDETIEKNTSHRNGPAREVGVVIHTFTDFNTSRGVHITSQKRENIVLAYLSKKIATSYMTLERTAPPWRALMIRLRSGGSAPPFAAREASSLG